MGKNLKGHEIGKGITQKKDGTYLARFTLKTGKRIEKCFKTQGEAKQWLKESKEEDRRSGNLYPCEMTTDEWFERWIEEAKRRLAPNTVRNYRERYQRDAKGIIGGMKLRDVGPAQCQMIFNQMNDHYASSTMRLTYIALGAMFKRAKVYDLISKHPLDKVIVPKKPKTVDCIRFLSADEQTKFLAAAKESHNYNQYSFILETGLRTGEMIGLTWDQIDWDQRTITVNKSLEYRYANGCWYAGPTKSVSGYRTIPLTDKAYSILVDLYNKRKTRKEAFELSTILKFRNCRSGKIESFSMYNLVFVNYRTGMPTKNSSYDTHLYKLCDKAGIERISMHSLRHTYATRAIERNVNPKMLQKLLGHSSLQMTMDRYVHISPDTLAEAVRQFERGQNGA